MNEERLKLKNKIGEMQEKSSKSIGKKVNHKPLKSLSAGDKVYVISFDQYGTALSAPDNNGEVMVQAGIMKIKVPLKELMMDDREEPKKQDNNARRITTRVKSGKSQFISPEIDCRGQTVDEGLGNIDKYIDDAYLAGLKKITIIHGKGTGALRSAVWKYLRTNPHVVSFRQGDFTEGELGVTVVELK